MAILVHIIMYGAKNRMECLLDFSLSEIQEKFEKFGFEKYRAKQVYFALQQGKTFDECTVLSAEIKKILNQNFISQPVSILKILVSKDGTTKYLFSLTDNNVIEGVLMKYKFGNTLCVSTQVGCAMGCVFCASTMEGLVRNLTSGEILGQVIQVNKSLDSGLGEKRKVTNIVLMGSGEPLANYKNVTNFLDLVMDENGLNVSSRNISLSTCGVVDKIEQLAKDGYKVTLSLSLHAPTDEIRKKIMRIANTYTLKQVIDACKYYYEKTKRRMIFEYILINDINSSKECAKQLADLVKGLNVHINLIPLNEVNGLKLKTVSKNQVNIFQNELLNYGISATVRRTLGDDIEGACGQLRRRYLNKDVK